MRIWLCAFMLGLCGCAGDSGKDFPRPETLADLQTTEQQQQDDLPVEHSLEKAIHGYQQLLPLVANTPYAAEVVRRLADLGVEASEIAQANIAEEGVDVAQVNQQSQAQQQQAIQLYQRALRDYPQHPANQAVLYQLARVYEQQGNKELLLETLSQLNTRYPDSDRYAEVAFRRGELLFARKAYRDAELAYAEVIAGGEGSAFYEQSLYMHGWSLFKQGQYDPALASFFELLDRKFSSGQDANAALTAMSGGEREQLDDVLRVVSLAFSYQEGADSLAEYLAQHPQRHYESVLYEKLADHYLQQERYSDAAATYAGYVVRNPLQRRAPFFLVKVIEAYDQGKFPSQVIAAKKNLAEAYAFNSEYWQQRTPASEPEIVAYLKTNLDELAKHYHASAQASKKPADYAEAARWYRRYLQDFSQDSNAAEMNFLLADLLFESHDYSAAAEEYIRVAYEYPSNHRSAEAAYAAVLAYRQQQTRVPATETAVWQKKSTASGLRFAAQFPQHPQALAVLTLASENLYADGDLLAAETAAQHVLQSKQASTSQQRTAWVVTAHSRFDQQQFQTAEQAYMEALALTATTDKQRADLYERLAASIYKQGELARAENKHAAAAEHFLRVAKLTPKSRIRANADYDAATELLNAKDWQASATLLEAFRRDYPQHQQQFDVTQKLALIYLQTGQTQKAAAEMERIETSSKDPEQRRQALLKAAELYTQAQQTDQAIAAHQRFIRSYPQPLAPAFEARWQIAELYQARGDQGRYEKALQDVIDTDAKAGRERTDRTRLLAARASLILAKPIQQAYAAKKLTAPLKTSVAAKKKAMQQTLSAYTRAADYGIEDVTTEATYQIADVYYDFGQALLHSERPKKLSAEELEQYDILLEEQAYPFEEKAIEVHQINAERVRSGVYDQWVKRSFNRLAELMPARYNKQELAESYVENLH